MYFLTILDVEILYCFRKYSKGICRKGGIAIDTVFDPSYWAEYWKARHRSLAKDNIRQTKEQINHWNSTAKTFSSNLKKDPARQQETLDFLKNNIPLKPGMKVLDIGCGPGTFAVPLAEMGLHVTALDPSEQMLSLIKENSPANLPGTITPVLGVWEKSVVESQGWYGQFDLVFASLSPGINTPDDLSEMIKCSREWCFLSTFAGPRSCPLLEDLWPLLFNTPYKNHLYDFILPFNYLYSLGYFPVISYHHVNTMRLQTVDEARDDILRHIQRSSICEITDDLIEKIHLLLNERAENGSLYHGWIYSIGMLIFSVKQKRTIRSI